MNVERERPDVRAADPRCPVCDEPVAAGATECGTCSTSLAVERRDEPSPRFDPPASGEEADRNRRETSQLLEDAEGEPVFWPFVLAVATLGLAPILGAEWSLRKHRAKNEAELAFAPIVSVAPDVREKILEARRAATGQVPAWHGVRAILATIVLAVAAIDVVATLTARHSSFEAFYVAQAFAALAACANLHLHREAVRRHEIKQFFARLVGDAVPPSGAKAVLDRTGGAWNLRRALDVLLTVGAFVPLAGLVALPVALLRLRGTLALHEKHERSLPRPVERPAKS